MYALNTSLFIGLLLSLWSPLVFGDKAERIPITIKREGTPIEATLFISKKSILVAVFHMLVPLFAEEFAVAQWCFG